MSRERLDALARDFPQNGIKLLLEDAHNVQDLFIVGDVDVIDLIDFERLTLDRTSYVLRDYRHIESDLVLRAPVRAPNGRRSRKRIVIHILIEHQSKPDAFMVFRVLEYVVQIYKAQMRAWRRDHSTFQGFQFQPVLPVVFYTGKVQWDALGSLIDLVALGSRFSNRIPKIEPSFINLRAIAPSKLETEGRFLGWVLRLIQQADAGREEFQALVERAVQHLEAMPKAERLRLLELLSYIQALVYHVRSEMEQPSLQKTIETSVSDDTLRQEVIKMRQTGADSLREEGRKRGKREGAIQATRKNLLCLLKGRFDQVPARVQATIKKTTDLKQLAEWIDRFAKADTLDDVGINETLP
jgi:predicted transposase/invertase (TIGR01784 family)